MTVGRRTSLQDAVRRFDGTGKPQIVLKDPKQLAEKAAPH